MLQSNIFSAENGQVVRGKSRWDGKKGIKAQGDAFEIRQMVEQ